MSDAQPVAEVTVRAVTNENIEIDRKVTDKDGMAAFDREKLNRLDPGRVHLFVADSPNGPGDSICRDRQLSIRLGRAFD